uniref:CSON013476 protein n=1 Tax=Culicoides sonorensis TaxID=179676 RepID=A0A336LMQ5_CULSO
MAITSTLVETFFITLQFRSGVNGLTCLVYLFNAVIFNWILAFFLNYQARRSLGIFMIVSYFVFIIFMFLCEEQILHPFGTDHINQVENLDNDMYRIN